MKSVPTFTAQIYVGIKERDTGELFSYSHAYEFLQKYVNDIGLCVTVTPTNYIYTNGGEPGFVVGLINYPRFPDTPECIRSKALEIAEGLREIYKQYKVSVVFPDETVMVEMPENK